MDPKKMTMAIVEALDEGALQEIPGGLILMMDQDCSIRQVLLNEEGEPAKKDGQIRYCNLSTIPISMIKNRIEAATESDLARLTFNNAHRRKHGIRVENQDG